MKEHTIEIWRKVFRQAIAPSLSTRALQALHDGVESKDERLVRGMTTVPPPLPSVQDWPVESACALGYCGWIGEGLPTVGEVDEFFARLCFEIDNKLGEPSGCRWWLNFWDEAPWEEVHRETLIETKRALAQRMQENTNDRSAAQSPIPV